MKKMITTNDDWRFKLSMQVINHCDTMKPVKARHKLLVVN